MLCYEAEHSAFYARSGLKVVAELAEYDNRFRGFEDGLDAARAVAEDLGRTARDFGASLEFSPERLNEIEERLAEITRLKRKYGDSIEAVLEHLRVSEERLSNIETADLREAELQQLDAAASRYRDEARKLHEKRIAGAKQFSRSVRQDLKAVALDKARFETRVDEVDEFAPDRLDRVEFYFSANPGEQPRPLVKVASGGGLRD